MTFYTHEARGDTVLLLYPISQRVRDEENTQRGIEDDGQFLIHQEAFLL